MAVDRSFYAWSPEEAARAIGCTPDHVRALCRSGALMAVHERRLWFIAPDSARRYMLRRQGYLTAKEHQQAERV